MSTTRKITVISSSVTKQGDTWTLSELVATDERGEPITKTLKTFETNLPLNQLIDVEVQKNDNPKYDEYMVRLPGSKGGGGGGKGSGLGQSVDLLRQDHEQLKGRVAALESRMDAQTAAGTAATTAAPTSAPPSQVPDDDDIPF